MEFKLRNTQYRTPTGANKAMYTVDWSLAKNARTCTALRSKYILRCRSEGKRRTPGGTGLRWVDLLNRHLAKIPNWQELI